LVVRVKSNEGAEPNECVTTVTVGAIVHDPIMQSAGFPFVKKSSKVPTAKGVLAGEYEASNVLSATARVFLES
jgi:hypothetical protein